MSAMVQIFSWGERWNVLFNKAKPSWIENMIFHRMKIYVPSYEWKTSLFVLYNIKNIVCHLERKINLNILKNAILFWSCRFKSKITAVYHCTVLFNDRWIVYLFHITWPCIIQSNDKNLHWCYIIPTGFELHSELFKVFFCIYRLVSNSIR